MSDMERITITLTQEMAEAVRIAIKTGEYATSSEIIREALRDWRHKKSLQERQLAELQSDVQEGVANVKAGRVKKFDARRIVEKGKKKLAKRAPSN